MDIETSRLRGNPKALRVTTQGVGGLFGELRICEDQTQVGYQQG